MMFQRVSGRSGTWRPVRVTTGVQYVSISDNKLELLELCGTQRMFWDVLPGASTVDVPHVMPRIVESLLASICDSIAMLAARCARGDRSRKLSRLPVRPLFRAVPARSKAARSFASRGTAGDASCVSDGAARRSHLRNWASSICMRWHQRRIWIGALPMARPTAETLPSCSRRSSMTRSRRTRSSGRRLAMLGGR